MSVGVFPLQSAEASKVVTELEKVFGEGSNSPEASDLFLICDSICSRTWA